MCSSDLNFDEVFQVVEVHGDGVEAKAYTLSNLKGKRDGLGFTQPVASDRLTPVDMLPLAQPSVDTPTRIAVRLAGVEHDGTVINQSIDGKVYIKFDDSQEERCFDLSSTQYRWLP